MSAGLSSAFNVEDMAKIRNYYSNRYLDENGNVDWDKMNAETAETVTAIRAEIEKIRNEKSQNKTTN
ncbi:MAG: hypothetical protein FWG64_05225 [Firmicutes bacterium]|nr:hypothetical protein [Bacillota bacterium]